MINKIKEKFKELQVINSGPREIALGFSIGTFIAILPTFGLGILFAMVILFFKKDLNKLALLLAFAIWNPFVLIPINALAYQIGDIILQSAPVLEIDFSVTYNFYHVTRRLLLGNFILTIFISIASYFLIYESIKPSKYLKK